MKFTLKDYQAEAVRDALANLRKSRKDWKEGGYRSAFSLTAVTGAGKTVMAAAALEALFYGDDEYDFDPDPGAVVIWFSDDPSLNEQTRFRLMEASDRIRHTDLVVVENTFSRAKFEPGKIYFLNTQKLGKNSLLVRGQDSEGQVEDAGPLFPETRPDLRSHTIWETISNTVEDPDLTLYLLLDEAHRGMGNPNAAAQSAKSTIVQRLINGAQSVPGIPVVWGISATVERFKRAMDGAVKRITLPDVVVDATKVQESGLIKDSIILDLPRDTGDFDTVLVRRATDKLKVCTTAWAEYADLQAEAQTVIPLMVLQVPNKPDPDDIGRALDTIFQQWPELPTASVAHVLGDHSSQRYGNWTVPYMAPERVQESAWVRVLIAKDAISTGWDCPRAEVMISFRAAVDRTHITQLLGRMVRSPLARRIPGSDRLNSVDCLLPKFDAKTVGQVVDALLKGDDSATPPPGRVLINPVEVKPNPGALQNVWIKFESLPSQTRPQRGAKPIKRLTALAHELASDAIVAGAGKKAHAAMHVVLDRYQESEQAKIKAARESVLTVEGKTVVADLKGKAKSFDQFWEDADLAVINDAYRRAARSVSPDVARTYVDVVARRIADPADEDEFDRALVEARVIVAALGLVTEVQLHLDSAAANLAEDWFATYNPAVKQLSHDRQEAYRLILEMSAEPQNVGLVKPQGRFEATQARDSAGEALLPTYSNHLLCDDQGKYPADLNSWESRVVDAEMSRKGFLFWYRNPQQPGESSLGIAYRNGENYAIVRPDFIFFATSDDGTVLADIVDPHGLHLADALPKLQGLALYAKDHAQVYRRIECVAEALGKLRMLDLTREDVRQAIGNAQDAVSLFSGILATDY